MKYKVGDTVRIQSMEWMEAQKKDSEGVILGEDGYYFSVENQEHACERVLIMGVSSDGCYAVASFNGKWRGVGFRDWVFDSDYKEDDPLPVEDAIRAMLEGEMLRDVNGNNCIWNIAEKRFEAWFDDGLTYKILNFPIPTIYRRPQKRRRPMTPVEAQAWAESDESLGWMVRYYRQQWQFPRDLCYYGEISNYERARMLPDMSGVDESTIQGFEVEEEI
jgi:hypothetical protein